MPDRSAERGGAQRDLHHPTVGRRSIRDRRRPPRYPTLLVGGRSADRLRARAICEDGDLDHAANGRHQHEIIRLGDQRTPYPVEPSFSPSGGRIVFGLRHSIATVGIHGNDLRQLVFGWRGPGAVRSPEYSPDGKRIAFAGRPGRRDVRTSIWTMDRNGSHLRRLTRPPQTYGYGVDDSPDWRPDGRRIEFLYCYDERCSGGLYSVRSDGSDRRPLVSSSYPGLYSPSGRRVALYSLGYDSVHQNVKCGDIFNVTVPRRPWQPPVPSITHNCGADRFAPASPGLRRTRAGSPYPAARRQPYRQTNRTEARCRRRASSP